MDSSRSAQAPSPSSDAIDFVRFCYRRRRVGWPELYDEMCAVAGRGLYRGWRFSELEEHGIGFSLHQTLELARIAGQVATEEGERRGRAVARSAVSVAETIVEPVAIPILTEPPEEPVIDVPILVAVAGPSDSVDETVAGVAGAPVPEPAISPISTPARPALSPSMIRSAAGAG